MELVEGPILGDRLATSAMEPDEALPVFAQIAEAPENARGQGIVHRDLKPANIKVIDEGRVKVLDFGLAKANDEKISGGSSAASPGGTLAIDTESADVTSEGKVLGTPAYMSPEMGGRPRKDTFC